MRFIGNAPVDGEVRAIASGALATGDAVVVNSDGTVSVVGGSDVSENIGSPNTFQTGVYRVAPVYDSNSNKLVIVYTGAAASSYYGTAVVGTISGTSISFGTPVVFNSDGSANAFSGVFDPNTNKVIYNFKSANVMRTVVGTVSGTSISFGSATTLESQSSNGSTSAIAYDTVNNKIVSVYTNLNNPRIRAKVGTVSGTTISYGSYVQVNSVSAAETANYVAAAFDTNSGNVAIFWQNASNSYYGTSIAGTVSGTSITFGDNVIYSPAYTIRTKAVYDSLNSKVVIAWHTNTPSTLVKAIVGTVSGSGATATISYGTAVDIDASDYNSGSLAFEPNSGKIVAHYPDTGNSSYPVVVSGEVSGTSISFGTPSIIETSAAIYGGSTVDTFNNRVIIGYERSSDYTMKVVSYQPAYTSTNLTSENFVGFANSGYADGQSAAVNSTCAVDNKQSGLTAGETYYVQTDGTLGTTPADPSVVAGTAISSNSIIVKG